MTELCCLCFEEIKTPVYWRQDPQIDLCSDECEEDYNIAEGYPDHYDHFDNIDD